MSWVAVAVGGIGAAAGATGSYLSAKDKQKRAGQYTRDDYGTLNPEQRRMMGELGPAIQSGAKTGSTYGGAYNSAITPGEQQMADQASRLGAISGKSFEGLMSGEFPEDYYQNAVYRPLMKQYQEDIQPQIEEQYAGPGGGYWGSARAGAVGKGYRDVYDRLATERATLAKEARELPIQAGPAAVETLGGLQKIAGLPRLIQDYGMQKEYDDWVSNENRKVQYVNAGIDFMRVGSVTNTHTPDAPSPWPYVLGGVSNFAKSMRTRGVGSRVSSGGPVAGGGGGGYYSGPALNNNSLALRGNVDPFAINMSR